MFSASHNLKVRQAIVEFVFVPVMNNLGAAEGPAKGSFNDKPVLRDLPAVYPNPLVSAADRESFDGSYHARSRTSSFLRTPVMNVAESSRVYLPRASFDFTKSIRISQGMRRPYCSAVPPSQVVHETKRSGVSFAPTGSYAAAQSSSGPSVAEVGNPCHAQDHSTEKGEKSCLR